MATQQMKHGPWAHDAKAIQRHRSMRGMRFSPPAMDAPAAGRQRVTGYHLFAQTMPMPTAAPSLSLLVVDDEPEMRGLLAEYFGRHGFAVREAGSATQAREHLAAALPDLALFDINMPGEDGLSLLRWLRDKHPQVPVVLLTANGDLVDRVVGLEIGADDYVAKPCELRELLARVRAVLRRAQTAAVPAVASTSAGDADAGSMACVPFGEGWLNLDTRELLTADGRVLETTAAEFDLLALFARHPNRPLTRDQIMEQAHNRGWDVFDRSIDLRIMRLRRKIERNPDKPEILKTVRNVGYVFVSPTREGQPTVVRPPDDR
jgi:DNA-binding response OmpR family regulator